MPGPTGPLSLDLTTAHHFERNNSYDVINMNIGRNSNGYAFIHGSQRDYEYRVWDYEFRLGEADHCRLELIVRRYQLLQERFNLQVVEYDNGVTYSPAPAGTLADVAYFGGDGNIEDAGVYLYTNEAASAGNPPSDPTYWTPCLLYTSPSPRDLSTSRMPSSA